MGAARADGKAVHAVVGLRPPAIEDGEIESAVQHYLLPAGAGRFQRPPRIVQPNVNALHEVAPDVDVVILDEDKFVGELRIAHQVGDLLQHFLAGFVQRVRLAGKNKLHRTFWIVDHRSQPLNVFKDQIGTLISGKAPRKTYREGVRAEHALQALNFLARFDAALSLLHCAPTYKFQKTRFQN